MSEAPSKAFGQLHERVQRWVWQQSWTELREAQELAVAPILSEQRDVIIASTTASGKTEAAFLPIGSRLAETTTGAALVLYVSPLKALINDQFSRLDPFLEYLEYPVYPWHGDIAATRKKAFAKDPRGVLLITPESLEGLFVAQGFYIHSLLRNLRFSVVDEVHSFVGTERGRQLQSLLQRVEAAVRRKVPRIGLSATLGDVALAAEWLRPGGGAAVQSIVAQGQGQELKLIIRGFEDKAPAARTDFGIDSDAAEEPVALSTAAIAGDLFNTLRGSNNLVFANSRRNVELFSDVLRRRCEDDRLPNEFWPHHGSLSKDLREHVETALKEKSRPTTAICTSTLELGIDIGSVKSIAQVDSPFNVASLRQRLGRSGRRGEPAILRMYIREPELTERHSPVDALRPQLLQALAIVRLLLARWCEPPEPAGLHLSTLVHQVLSVIAERGGITPADAWGLLCRDGPFRSVDSAMFAHLLRVMGDSGLILQSADGALLHAEQGERIVNHYSFFTVFVTPEEYTVVCSDKKLGTLPLDRPLQPKTLIIFAGRRWRVLEIDERRKTIEVTRASAGRVPAFGGQGGSVHDRIRREMLAVYQERDAPPYLDAKATELLTEARRNFCRYELDDRNLISTGNDTLLFLWRGDRIMDTVAIQLQARGFSVANEGIALQVADVDCRLLRKHLEEIVSVGLPDSVVLAESVVNKQREKYDYFLSEDLLSEDYASCRLDPQGAWDALNAVLRGN